MGLVSTIESGIATAFAAGGDLFVAAIVHVLDRNEMDTNVLRVVKTYVDNPIDLVLVTSYTTKELKQRGILPTDQKVLIQGVDSPTIPIPEDDEITISGKRWLIKAAAAAPSNVLYTLQVRAIV